MTTLLYGKVISDTIKDFITKEISKLDYTPTIAAIQAGNDRASFSYFKSQQKAFDSVGAKTIHIVLPEDISFDNFAEKIKETAADSKIDGIMILTPLPKGWDISRIYDLIPPEKDVEGIHPENLGRLYLGEKDIPLPCTANSAVTLLEHYGRKDFSGKNCVVLGRSQTVGRAISLLMLHRNATVTVCHTKTDPATLKHLLANADIVISAAGKAGIIDAKKLNKSAWVIDVGTNFTDGKMCGDVANFEDGDVTAISPVPGGVGPLTVALLLNNLLLISAKRRSKISLSYKG